MDWARRNSPLNKLFFPGVFRDPTYDADGGWQCGPSLRSELLWLPLDPAKPDSKIPTAFVAPHSVLQPGSTLKPTVFIVYMHGNAEDIGCSLPLFERLAEECNAVVMVPEYPGYGLAPGQPSSESIDATGRAVAVAMCSHLRVPPERIVVMGRSVGTGPAAALAAWFNTPSAQTGTRQPACLLVLHSPYTSLRDMARSIVVTVGGAILQRWNTAETLKHVGCPVLILHAREDEVIPYQHAERLYAQRHLYGVACELFTQSDYSDHNNFNEDLDIVEPVKDFVRRHGPDPSVNNPMDPARLLPLLTPWRRAHADRTPTTEEFAPGYTLLIERGVRNIAEEHHIHEQDALTAAGRLWSSWVLYHVALPGDEPREVRSGGVGFGHATVRRHADLKRSPSQRGAERRSSMGSSIGGAIRGSLALSTAAVAGSVASSGRIIAGDAALDDNTAVRRCGNLCQGIGAGVAASAAFIPPAAPILVPVGAAATVAGMAATAGASSACQPSRPDFMPQSSSKPTAPEGQLISFDDDAAISNLVLAGTSVSNTTSSLQAEQVGRQAFIPID